MISSLQLARLCGISQGTEDRALHNRPGINAATRKKILKMAERYGYKPHPAARELLGGKRTLVGALAPAQGSVFFMDLMNAIRQVLIRERFRFYLYPFSDESDFFKTLDDFAARRCAAILAVPPREGLKLTTRQTAHQPIITLLSPCQGAPTHFVAPDETATGRQAVEYLWHKGHRRILHLTYHREAIAIRDRAEGYRQAMQRQNAAPDVRKAADDQAIMRAIHAYRPSAVFCHNDWLALKTIRALNQAGLRVPDDISVLGVDNSPTFADLCPDISTLQYPMTAVAERCLAIIQGGFAQNGFAAGPVGRFEIVERRSVGRVHPRGVEPPRP
ncbi:MAG: LacI family DNA-binding transcriptional regulator [Kiritimatiellota bacterium]|nr:LacI family DNA-binding transcriptional regulator [Kiritimatiellota bacterium]